MVETLSARTQWSPKQQLGIDTSSFEKPVGHPWAVASKARLGESPLGSPTLYFELKNTSSEKIARIKVEVAVTEKGGRSVIGQGEYVGFVNRPVEPGTSRAVDLRIPLLSDLNAIFPEPNEVIVT